MTTLRRLRFRYVGCFRYRLRRDDDDTTTAPKKDGERIFRRIGRRIDRGHRRSDRRSDRGATAERPAERPADHWRNRPAATWRRDCTEPTTMHVSNCLPRMQRAATRTIPPCVTPSTNLPAPGHGLRSGLCKDPNVTSVSAACQACLTN
jgi:hypothetical protein